jgi:hypothetical protein
MSRHKPTPVVYDGVSECSVCSERVIGFGATLRHEGEAIATLVPDPEDAPAVERAVAIAHAVARRMPGAEPEELADAVTRELYGAGLLRRRRGERRGSVVLTEDEDPRDPDHAERAAGEAARVA